MIIGGLGGLMGSALSFLIRLELSNEGNIYLTNSAYNVVVTGHGILMIFFLIMPV